jgi:hypothetical protein
MLRSYKVVARFAVTDRFGITHEPEFYQKIHRNVKNSRRAWQEATEEVIRRAERKYGKSCEVKLLGDFKVLHHLDKSKLEKNSKKVKQFPKRKHSYLFTEFKTDREMILEARREIYAESFNLKKKHWDLAKDRMTDDQIKILKESPYEPENRWAMTEWKKRVKNWINKLQLKLFP